MRNTVQRMLFVGPRVESAESGANILMNNIVGILVGLVFMGFGIAWYIGSIDSAKTVAAENVLAMIATKVQQYYNDNGSYPGAINTWDPSFFSNTQYFATPPIDPAAPSATNSFDLYVYDNGAHFMIADTAWHPERTLSSLPTYQWNGAAPYSSGLCGNACYELFYTDALGMMGASSPQP